MAFWGDSGGDDIEGGSGLDVDIPLEVGGSFLLDALAAALSDAYILDDVCTKGVFGEIKFVYYFIWCDVETSCRFVFNLPQGKFMKVRFQVFVYSTVGLHTVSYCYLGANLPYVR